jgi:hypothetical protein
LPPLNRSIAALLLIVLLVSAPGGALETDQYYAWERPLADSTDALNARFNLELERVLADFPVDAQPAECTEISIAYRKRLRFILFHSIQLWTMNTSLVARIPADPEENRTYRKTNLYSNHPLIDSGTWMPFTPTIEAAGVRFGTDKLSHLVSSGWTYYSTYNKALKSNGHDPHEAVRAAVRRGILEESMILGAMVSGVTSLADLAASLQGLFFYSDLCDAENPILQRGSDGWTITRPIDLRDYVGPRWDESYQPPIFSKGRWRKVRPVLVTYCDRLANPQVVEMLHRYRARDTQTVVGEVVAELVAVGKLEDPAQFGLETVCAAPEAPAATPPDTTIVSNPPPAVGASEMKERIIAEEQDRRGMALGLLGFQLTYPQVVAASIGVMATSQPSTFECSTACDFWGPFAQLEPGLGGGKLSIGWGRAIGTTGKDGRFLTNVSLALAGKATVLRTWGDFGAVASGRTFAGAELDFSVARVNFGLGVLYRVSSGDDSPWLVTGGIGWGF